MYVNQTILFFIFFEPCVRINKNMGQAQAKKKTEEMNKVNKITTFNNKSLDRVTKVEIKIEMKHIIMKYYYYWSENVCISHSTP